MARGSRDGREDRRHGREDRRRRRRPRFGLRRLVGWVAFLPIAARAPDYARLIWALVRDERTPAGRKAMLAAAFGYLVVGRDLVPDDLPLIGGLDDVVVVVLAVDIFLDGVPEQLLDEKLDGLGIDRRAFHEDVARIRRFTPGPLRRMMGRAPELISFAGDTLHRSGLGPKVRTWINKEGSSA